MGVSLYIDSGLVEPYSKNVSAAGKIVKLNNTTKEHKGLVHRGRPYNHEQVTKYKKY